MNKCKSCGKDIEAGVTVCPHCQKAVEAAPDTQKALIESVKGAVREEIAPLKESIKTIDERVKKIESMPAPKAVHDVNIIVPEKYMGYELSDQGEALREKFSARPKYFKALSQESKFKEFCRFMIDVKAALVGDISAQMKLQESMRQFKASDLSEGSNTLGGYTVPVEYQMDLIKLVREVSFAMQKCTVINMSSQTLKLPKEASMVSVSWTDEAGSITASNPVFDQVTLTAKKLAGLTGGISSELLMDTGIDIVGLLTEQFMYAIGLELDNQVLNGTGSPCSGVLTAKAGYSVVMATGYSNFSSISADNVRSMIRKLAAADAAVAEFVYSKDIQYYIDVLKDTYGRYVYREPAGDRPAALWNRAITEASNAPLEAASGASTGFVALANWKQFYLGRRLGAMAFASDPYTNFATDQVRFRAITRWGLAMARATAFCRLVTAA